MIRIASFNIYNDYKKDPINKSKWILKFCYKYKIDVLGLQELFKKCEVNILPSLKENNYSINGRYRYPKIFSRYNEKVPIITNKEIVNVKTYSLPYFPSLTRRVVTEVVIINNNKKISIFNTHLEYKNEKVKKKQLKQLLNIIKQTTNPVILMGDFNLKNNKEVFKQFIEDLKVLNIRLIETDDKTLKRSKYHRAIDHIFVSKEFKVLSKNIIKDIPISDHYPVLVDIQ